jgi:hypothetical protein
MKLMSTKPESNQRIEVFVPLASEGSTIVIGGGRSEVRDCIERGLERAEPVARVMCRTSGRSAARGRSRTRIDSRLLDELLIASVDACCG